MASATVFFCCSLFFVSSHIYIYMHAVKLLSGPSLGFWRVIIWAKLGLLSGPSLFSRYKNRGFRRFVFAQFSFCVFFCAQLSCNFLKIAFFEKKRVQKLGFSIFSVLSLHFENSLLLGLLKHNKNRGFSIFCVLLLKEKKIGKKNDNWNFWIWVFCPKMAVSWRITVFQKLVCWNPFLIVFWGCAFSGPSCQKKGISGHPPKNKKFLTDNWKAHFLIFFFVFFVLFNFSFVFCCCFCVLFFDFFWRV